MKTRHQTTYIVRVVKSLRVMALATTLLLCGCTKKHEWRTTSEDFSLIFTGDVLLDRGVRTQIEKRGIDTLFWAVRDTFMTADATIVNLECPLSDESNPMMKKFVFRANEEWAANLKQNGVTHAALANNHTYDQGKAGLRNTIKALQKNGIVPLGYGLTDKQRIKPLIVEKNNTTVALFNSVPLRLENWIQEKGEPGICKAKGYELANAIKEYKGKHPKSKVIAIVHWGIEFYKSPSVQQQIDANLLVGAGADVVIGHHPHVVQPTQLVKGKPVVFSLGNFVFDQRREDGRKAQMAKVTFKKDTTKLELMDVDIVKCAPVPTGPWKELAY